MLAGVRGWFDKDMVWLAGNAGRPGRLPVLSDVAVQLCPMVNVQFGLPLRQTTGMLPSILQMAGLDWPVPDVFTVSRRQKIISVGISSRWAPGPFNLLVDSTGIKFLGDGALSGDCFAIPCRVTNGWPASTAPIADANTARSIWRWTRPPARSGPWNSPQAGRGPLTACMQTSVGRWTAPSCRTWWNRFPPDQPIGTVTGPSRPIVLQSPAGQWIVSSTRGSARSGLKRSPRVVSKTPVTLPLPRRDPRAWWQRHHTHP